MESLGVTRSPCHTHPCARVRYARFINNLIKSCAQCAYMGASTWQLVGLAVFVDGTLLLKAPAWSGAWFGGVCSTLKT